MLISLLNIMTGILSFFLFGISFFNKLLFMTAGVSLVFGFIVIIFISIAIKSRQARILLLSFVPVFTGGVLWTLQIWFIIPNTFLTAYGLLIGGAFQFVAISIGLADRINIMKRDIQKAEKKYRHLVESSEDIIFSMDEDLNIYSINNAVRKHLGYRVEDVVGKNFLNFIHDTWSVRTDIARQLVHEQISDLYLKKSNVQFRAFLKTRYGNEPKDFSIKLEYTENEEAGYTTLGKASLVTDDALIPFLEKEQFVYTMDNYMNHADLMSQRLTRGTLCVISLVMRYPRYGSPSGRS